MRILVLLLITLLCCGACKEQYDHKGKTALVEVDGNFLYKEDLMSVLPVGLSKDDSILFAEHYIRSWAEEILLYEKAANNIPDNVDVDKLVENYRKALIMHTYQQELINQKLTNDISEQEIADYYEKNKELFKLESPLIKGLFIKVPLTAPQLNSVRRWYKTEKQDAVESLEKYSLQNAVKYEYFYNKWVPVTDVLDLIPLKEASPEQYVDKHRHAQIWYESVLKNCRINKTTLHIDKPGKHTVKIICGDAGTVLQKVVLDFGGMKRSYMGPRPTRKE